MLRDTPREGYAACCAAIGDFDVRNRLGGIGTPTLVIAGAQDPATPPDVVRLVADGILGAEFVVVPGAAHLPTATHPRTVDPILHAHLRR